MAKEVDDGTASVGWVEGTRQYVSDVRNEFDKVTWPQRKEAVGGTIGVLVIVAVITAVLSMVDLALARLVAWILP